MTARPERLLACSYASESSWAEATDTWGTRLQLIGQPTVSLTQDRIAEPISQQYAEEGKAGVLGVRGGEITISLALTGHGGTTAGSLTATDLYTLMKLFFGGGDADDTGDTVSSATDAGQFAVTPSTYNDGALIRVGALGDGRCEGQWGAVLDGTTITTLTDMPGTPNAADVVYAAQNIYPLESTNSSTVTSLRFLVQTANNQYKLRGCFPTSWAISGLSAGEQPQIDLTFACSWWDFASETFPSATATDAKAGTICSNGSFFYNDVGTTTRQTASLRSWSISGEMDTQPLMGPDAVNTYQAIVGARRVRNAVTFTTMVDAEAAGTTTWGDIFDAGTLQHILIGCSVVDGKALAFYFPNAELVSRPTQTTSDGLNRVECQWRALTGTDTASEREMASFVIGMA